MKRKCRTPGATFSIAVHGGGSGVFVMVNLPFPIGGDAAAVRKLKRRLHDGVEGALAETFTFGSCTQRIYGDRRGPRTMTWKKAGTL